MTEVLSSYRNSLLRFKEILQLKKTIVHRDAAIKRFEFTVELGWKCLQEFLKEQGIQCRSPKECLRAAFKLGLVRDDERWLQMIAERNLTVHTYNEQTAEEVYSRLPNYVELFDELEKGLSGRHH